MKISKLFHWLYAILMLLPFAFFVPSVLYYAFNDNATMQSVEVPKTETLAVDFNQKFDFIENSNDYVSASSNNGFITITYDNPTNAVTYLNFSEVINFEYSHQYYFSYRPTNALSGLGANFQIYVNSGVLRYPFLNDTFQKDLIFTCDTDTSSRVACQIPSNVSGSVSLYVRLFDLTQMFGSGKEPTIEKFNQLFPNSYYPYTESKLMQITYDIGETEQLVENTSIINYAWESIWDLPLFNWTKVTFVSVPFSYLTGIFGIGASNSLNYVFGYFVTISIVWLVFDLLLYVPMLAHNWIDKARIE